MQLATSSEGNRFFLGGCSSSQKSISEFCTLVFWAYPLVMTNIAMEAMAHRNRWFTVLKNGWNGGMFHGKLLVITRC